QRAEVIAHPPTDERPYRNPPQQTIVSSDTDRWEGGVCSLTKALLPDIFGETVKVNEEMVHLRSHAVDLIKDERAPRLVSWAERRHGGRAALALAIAATNPKIRDKAAWLGWFATTTNPVDLEGSAEAILQARPKPIVWAASKPGSIAERAVAAFQAKAGEGPAASYLSQASFTVEKETLVVSVPTRLAQERLDASHQSAMREAARAVGAASFRVERLRQ
ncbi:MAG: hypothetical protein AAF225_12750, partial [Pseudomonadota bacterium]